MMRKSYFFRQRLFAAILMLAGCASTSFATEEIDICPSISGSHSIYCFNSSCDEPYSTVQTIYTSDEMGDKSGNITAISYLLRSTKHTAFRPNMKIYMGVTSKSSFSETNGVIDAVPATDLTLVYDDTPALGTAAQGDWESVKLSNSFYYNGKDNLVVVVCTDGNDADTKAPYYAVYSPGGSSRLICRSTSPDQTSAYESYANVNVTSNYKQQSSVPCVKFTMGLSTGTSSITIGTDVKSSNITPYDNSKKYSVTQTVYTMGELGGAGKITDLSYYVSNASTYAPDKLQIYMGHKTAPFQENEEPLKTSDLTLVYSGTQPVLGQTSGWEKITLDNPFDYNGSANLVVVICKSSSTVNSALTYRYTSMSDQSYGRFREGSSSTVVNLDNTDGYSTFSQRPNIKFTKIDTNSDDADTDISSVENSVYVESAKANIGTDIVLSVKMKNMSQTSSGFSFTFVTPEGIDVKGVARGSRISDRDENDDYLFTLQSAKKSTGFYVQAYSNDGSYISGEDGEVAKLTLSIDESVAAGDYPLVILSGEIADNVTTTKTDRVKSTLSLSSVLVGDVNNDGNLSVGDLTVLVAKLSNRSTPNYNGKAADINGDGNVSVADLTMLAKSLLK